MIKFPVTQADRDLLVKYFVEAATGDPKATCPQLADLINSGSSDEMPMLQVIAFVRKVSSWPIK